MVSGVEGVGGAGPPAFQGNDMIILLTELPILVTMSMKSSFSGCVLSRNCLLLSSLNLNPPMRVSIVAGGGRVRGALSVEDAGAATGVVVGGGAGADVVLGVGAGAEVVAGSEAGRAGVVVVGAGVGFFFTATCRLVVLAVFADKRKVLTSRAFFCWATWDVVSVPLLE